MKEQKITKNIFFLNLYIKFCVRIQKEGLIMFLKVGFPRESVEFNYDNGRQNPPHSKISLVLRSLETAVGDLRTILLK